MSRLTFQDLDTNTVMPELRDHRVYWRDVRVELTLREVAFVQLLVTEPHRDVSYRELQGVAHGEAFIAGPESDSFQAVRSSIMRIRKKFRDVDPEFDGIENYESFGYRWREHVDVPHVLREVG